MNKPNDFTDWEEENFHLRAGKRSSYDVKDNNRSVSYESSEDENFYRYAPQRNFFYFGDRYPSNKKVHSLNFEKYADEGNRFINEIAARLKCDRNTAGRVTRAVIHALRDRLPVDDAIQFAQGLPMALKGVFIDQYDISKAPVYIRNADDFINFVRLKNRFSAVADFHSPYDVIRALNAVFYVLERHMDIGQIQQIKMMLPKKIVHLIDQDK
jgi:uncharacterized protein (DUF2267 family)